MTGEDPSASHSQSANGLERQMKQVTEAFAHHKELFKSVVDHLPVGVFCKDADDNFRFIIWNQCNADITGIPASEALGKTDFDLFPTEIAEKFRADDIRAMEENREVEIPSEDVRNDTDNRVIFHTRKVALLGPAGKRRYLLGISEDITARHVAEEKLSEANAQLRATQDQMIQLEKLESIGRLAAGVAHEVKNPLALILMGVEYLSEDISPNDENIPVIVEEMRAAVHRADKIVRGLVDFSSERQLDLQLVSVNTVLEHVLMMVRHELTKSSITVEKDFDPELPAIKVDNTKYEQVLVNLLMNAIHAMQSSPRCGRLCIRTRAGVAADQIHDDGLRTGSRLRRGEPVIITEIEDNGCGIPQEVLNSIFDPFYTTKPTGMGTGLGLTVVKKIVEIHQGQIDVRSNHSGGTTVTLTFKQAS